MHKGRFPGFVTNKLSHFGLFTRPSGPEKINLLQKRRIISSSGSVALAHLPPSDKTNGDGKKSPPSQVGVGDVQFLLTIQCFEINFIRSVLAKLVNWAIHSGKIYISDGGNILIKEVKEESFKIQKL